MDSSALKTQTSLSAIIISDEKKFIEEYLKSHLPYSLPLLRRCQFHIKQKSLTPSAEVWLTSHADRSSPWLAAHIDLSNAGQTQIWTFASWESEYSTAPDPAAAVQASPQYPLYQQLFQALFIHLQHNHISKLSHNPPDPWQRLKLSGKLVSEPFLRSKVLFGTIAECLWPFLENRVTESGKSSISREDRPYLKYVVISKRSSLLQSLDPPKGLNFAPMGEQHLQTIIDRTNIPRTVETLRQLPNIGLFDEEEKPVAWGLLGKDASLSSLHTEPEYRRRGLAELVTRRLMADQVTFFDDDHADVESAVVYSHADVSGKNIASRRVMERIQGEILWRVAWIEVDLGELSTS